MPADLPALRAAADLIDEWGRTTAYDALINETSTMATPASKLFAATLRVCAATAAHHAADLRARALVAEALGPAQPEGGGT